jgi:hypothetical protein
MKVKLHFAVIPFNLKIYISWPINNSCAHGIFMYALELIWNIQFIKSVGQSYYTLGRFIFYPKQFFRLNVVNHYYNSQSFEI